MRMRQISFASAEHQGKKRVTRREKFLGEMDVCFADVVASQEEFPQIEIVPERIPEIQLDPPPP